MFMLLAYTGCDRRSEENSGTPQNTGNKELDFLQQNYNRNIKWAMAGDFLYDTSDLFSAAEEVDTGGVWGIKFYLFDPNAIPLVPLFESKVYDGSLEDSEVKSIVVDNETYLWYDSGDYFLGTSGGEEYSYIVDFRKKKVIEGHTIVQDEGDVKLYISPNAEPALREYMISVIREDFPELQTVRKDIKID